MEQRRSKRKKITISLDAKLISGDKSYSGFIENLSEHGLKWYQYEGFVESLCKNEISIKTAPAKTAFNIVPGSKIELECKLPSGEKMHLLCKVIWSYKALSQETTKNSTVEPLPKYTTIGMEIIDPPLKYNNYFKSFD